MINWESLIRRNRKSVIDFAVGDLSSTQFQADFAGTPNLARQVIKTYGTTYSRRLTRKALRRRGLLK